MKPVEVTEGATLTSPSRLRSQPIGTLPERLAVGRGSALFLDGRCSHPDAVVVDLHVVVDGREHPVLGMGQPPPGRLAGSDYWWAIVPVGPVARAQVARLRLRATLAGGDEQVAELGSVELRPEVEPGDLPPAVPGVDPVTAPVEEPLVAVCMASYEPPLALFERQIESIREQSHRNFVCVISDDCSSPEKLEAMRQVIGDDDRFHLFPSAERLGVYLNFERALALAPRAATHVALCDQDDRWYPHKLESLLRALRGDDKLAYSDMRIVAEGGAVISETYWNYRRNNHTNFGSLLVANTITGAASLFRREVLDYALPFPPRLGNNYHDHWVALVAMALGRVTYLDEPLYDYVQHGHAALGHARANAVHRRGADRRDRMSKRFERLQKLRHGNFHPGWRYLYFDLWCAIALTARVAEERCRGVMDSGKLRSLKLFRDSPQGVAWLAARSLRPLLGASETLSRERALLAALAWRRLVSWRTRAQSLRERAEGAREGARRGPATLRTHASGSVAAMSSNGTRPEWLTPILVDYFTRDGSTLMMRLLSTSPQIAVESSYPYERKYFSYLWRWSRVLERGDWPEDVWGPRAFGSLSQERNTPVVGPLPWHPRDLIESDPTSQSMSERCFELTWAEFSRRAAEWTRREHRDPRAAVGYYAEKHLNTWLIDSGELPAHRVVALLRDPRDTLVSIAAFEQTQAAGSHDRLHQVIARQRERLRWIAGLLESEESPVIRYEELIRDLPAVAVRLEAWLAVELNPEAVENDKLLRKRHSTAKSPEDSIGRWKQELDEETAETVTRELRAELAAVGLET
jgi:glycosyltransferase involved in cell wall biosynthesis